MPQQFFHCHDIDASIQKARSKSMTQRVPRHFPDSRFLTSQSESCFQDQQTVCRSRDCRKQNHSFCLAPKIRELAGFRVDRNGPSLFAFWTRRHSEFLSPNPRQTSAKRKFLRSANPYSEQIESDLEYTALRFGEAFLPLPDSKPANRILNSRKNFTLRTGFEIQEQVPVDCEIEHALEQSQLTINRRTRNRRAR